MPADQPTQCQRSMTLEFVSRSSMEDIRNIRCDPVQYSTVQYNSTTVCNLSAEGKIIVFKWDSTHTPDECIEARAGSSRISGSKVPVVAAFHQ